MLSRRPFQCSVSHPPILDRPGSRAARIRATTPYPTKPSRLRVYPGLADADLDGPVAYRDPTRRIALRLARIVATLGLALIPTVGFVIGLKLYTHVSPLEIGMIRALGGFLVLSLIVIWPTFDE